MLKFGREARAKTLRVGWHENKNEMSTSYNILITKIDQFIRKFYKNQIIKGLIIGLSILGLFYLSVFLLEYFNHFSIQIRTILFYATLAISLVVFVKLILLPVLGFLKIGKVISRQQASKIIADHFPYIKDKLLNTIELNEVEQNRTTYSTELIVASIEQRINELKPIPFSTAIDFRRNIPLLKYFGIVAVFFILILSFTPQIISEGSERILNYRTFYSTPAPFTFTLMNDSLFVEKGNDFTVRVNVTGDYAPLEVYIGYSGSNFIMKKISNVEYEYQFRNLNNSVNFFFMGDALKSEKYSLHILPSPAIIDFSVSVEVPAYTGETDILLENIGDLTIPEGSKVSWQFNTIDSDSMFCRFNDSILNVLEKSEANSFVLNKVFKNSSRYSISVVNKFLKKNNVVDYYINVVPDLYPAVDVISKGDSINPFVIHFLGNINDDYGFNKLQFKYTVDDEIDSLVTIPINKGVVNQDFYFGFDFSKIKTDDSKKVEYYFEVYDNDQINGSKSSRSNLFVYKIPSKDQIDSLSNNSSEKMEDMLKESMDMAKKLQQDVKKLKDKSFQSELSSWEQKQMIEDILKQENQLENLLEELAKENKSKEQLDNSMSEMNEEMLKKQEQIQDLLENVLDDELKKLLEELQKIQDKLSPKDMEKLTEELDLSMEDLNEQLDRNLEMLKKFDIQNKVEDKIDELKKLADDQKELSEKAENKEMSDEDLAKEQKEQKEQFEKLQEEYKEIMEDNKELKSPMDLDDFKEESNEIQENFEQNQENLEKGKSGKASKGQKKNSENLEKMSQDMQKMMDQSMAQEASENMDDIRQIIENLVTFSFDQEDLMQELSGIDVNDPKIISKRDQQNKLADDFDIIHDSIYALAQRVPQLSTLANKELLAVKKGLKRVDDGFDEAAISTVTREQQFIMTAANNLALLLGEALASMQQQMSMQSQGTQNCQKPGKGKPSFSMMQQMQQSLKEQVKGMLDQMKSGKGEKGKMDKNGMNKKMAQMLAQQEIFRKMLNELGSGTSINSNTQKILNEINKLVQDNEKELVNKQISPELFERQKLILSRLLEAEKSENEREIEKKRKSKENKEELLSNPEKYFEYKDRKHNFSELFEKNNVALKNYYNNKYKKYLKQLNEDQ